MSLLKVIQDTRKSPENARFAGWSHPDTWNLVTTIFLSRQEAGNAYHDLKPIYDNIVAEQTWDALTSKGIQPTATEVSFRHHLWIDENDDGFTLCCSFDNSSQAHEFKQHTVKTYPQTTFEYFTILQSLSDQINAYMTATYSVEIDISNQSYKDLAKQAFDEVANDRKYTPALYTDIIDCSAKGFKRMKAYFADEASAMSFKQRCKVLEQRGFPEGFMRQFPAAKPEQPKRSNIA